MLIMKVPGLNNLGKNKECRDAGNAVVGMLDEIHSNEEGKPIDKMLLDVEEIEVDNNNIEEQEKLIYRDSKKIMDKGERIIFLGGDHSISYSIGRAFLECCEEKGRESCLIVFDAHADCCEPGKEPTHEEWLRALIERGFPCANIMLVGARNLWRDEIRFLDEKKIKSIRMNELNNNLEEATDIIMEFSNGKELYLSIDIDVIDPAFAPNTGYKEIGGLTSRQMLYIISRMRKMKNLRVVDIVEVGVDRIGATVKLASKLLAELL
jgi:agmatinase